MTSGSGYLCSPAAAAVTRRLAAQLVPGGRLLIFLERRRSWTELGAGA